MALNHLGVTGKTVEVADGTTYAYIHIPASSPKATFLFLHGFPSTSYDWRHQIKPLSDLGYGIVAPDLLGYGDTDKPAELEKYKMKTMAGHLAEILDKESLTKVIGVGHDWGCGILSRLWNYYPEKISALVFTSVAYQPPAPFDLDALNAMTEQIFGYATFGYWYFFNEDDAAELCNRNLESFTSLVYPEDAAIWKTELGPRGKAKAWVEANIVKPRPAWFSETEASIHNQIFAAGGFTGPFNWYKAAVRNINKEDDAQIPEEQHFVDVPTLVVVSDEDLITRAEMAEHGAPEKLKNFKIEKILGAGHWIPVEKKDEYNHLLIKFAEDLAGK